MSKKLKVIHVINNILATYFFLVLFIDRIFPIYEDLLFSLMKFSLIPVIFYIVYVYKKGYMRKIKEIKKTNYYTNVLLGIYIGINICLIFASIYDRFQ